MTQYLVREVANIVGLSPQGIYALRRRYAERTGEQLGKPSGVHVGVGEVIMYDDEDIATILEWREKNPPKRKAEDTST